MNEELTLRLLASTNNPDVAHDLCVRLVERDYTVSSSIKVMVEPEGLAEIVLGATASMAVSLTRLAREVETQVEIASRERRKTVLLELSLSPRLTPAAARVLHERLDYWVTAGDQTFEEAEDSLCRYFDEDYFVEFALEVRKRRNVITEPLVRKLVTLDPKNRLRLKGLNFGRVLPQLSEPGDLSAMEPLCTPPQILELGARQLIAGYLNQDDLETLVRAHAMADPKLVPDNGAQVPGRRSTPDWTTVSFLISNMMDRPVYPALALTAFVPTSEQLAELIQVAPNLICHVPVRLRDLTDDVLQQYVETLFRSSPIKHTLLNFSGFVEDPEAAHPHGIPVYWASREDRQRIKRVCGADIIEWLLYRAHLQSAAYTPLPYALAETWWTELSNPVRRALFLLVLKHESIHAREILSCCPGLAEDLMEDLPSWLIRRTPKALNVLVRRLEERIPRDRQTTAMQLLLEHLPSHDGVASELIELIDALVA